MKKITLILVLFTPVLGCFQNNKASSPPLEIPDIEPIQNSNLNSLVEDNSVYEIGYEEGKKAFFAQNNLDYNSSVFEKTEYTAHINSDSDLEDDETSKEDIRTKGYIDGYHKASESIMCPRREYY